MVPKAGSSTHLRRGYVARHYRVDNILTIHHAGDLETRWRLLVNTEGSGCAVVLYD